MAQIGHRIVLDVVRELDQTLDQDDLRAEVFVGTGHNFAHGHDLEAAHDVAAGYHGLLEVDFAAGDYDGLEEVHGFDDDFAQTFGQIGGQVVVWRFDGMELKSS